jgi:hypothetical protein
VYYIEDTAASALYGVREQVIRYKGITPLGLTSTDAQNAANQLIQQVGTDLQRLSQVLKSYEITVTGFKHIVNGVPTFSVGDTLHVVYRGITYDLSGKRKWIDVDAQLYVMDYTRSFAADGSDTWAFTVSTVRRAITSDGNVTAGMLDQIQAVQSAASPYVLFTSTIRADTNGIQVAAPSTSPSVVGMWWVNALSATPGSDTNRGYVDGHANGTETVTAATAVNGSNTAAVFVTATAAGAKYVNIRSVLLLDPVTSDPAVLSDGMIWYRSDLPAFRFRQSGATTSLTLP